MKVLYFHQHFTTPDGSTGIRSYEMARRLLSQGHEVSIVCGTYKGAHTGVAGEFVGGVRRGRVDGIEVIELDLAYANADGFLTRAVTFLRYALRSVRLALTERYDLVFATSTPLTAGIPGIMARLLRRKPFVFEVRDLWPELPKAMGVITNPVVLGMMSMLEWVSYRTASRVIGLSPGIVEGIRRRGVPAERVHLVPNGCDIDLFGEAVAPWRPDGVGHDDLLAVFAGTHGIANGLGAVIDAAEVLQARGRTDIKIVLIGEGKLKRELMERARRSALTNVLFLDPVKKTRLSGLLAGSDIGLQILSNVPAFYYGTSPNKFFDYLAAGLPVLNNYPGWLAEIIRENQCGYAVRPDDPQAFADALEDAQRRRSELKAMGVRARRLAESSFSRDRLSHEWARVVTSVAHGDA